jgi:peptidoglycan hydrolase-like protein with peptidoglycan-binding domain
MNKITIISVFVLSVLVISPSLALAQYGTGGTGYVGFTIPFFGRNSTSGNTGQVLGAATFAFNQELLFGMSGQDIVELQNKLKALGFFPKNTPASGFFGKITMKAVIDFQKANGLPLTGYVDGLTMQALNK